MIEHTYDRENGESRLTIVVTGGSDVFRFAVNLLEQQVEFCAVGRSVLVEQRENIGAKPFDEFAERMLGVTKYADLKPNYFVRDKHCVACERYLKSTEPRRKLAGARIVCRDCEIGDAS